MTTWGERWDFVIIYFHYIISRFLKPATQIHYALQLSLLHYWFKVAQTSKQSHCVWRLAWAKISNHNMKVEEQRRRRTKKAKLALRENITAGGSHSREKLKTILGGLAGRNESATGIAYCNRVLSWECHWLGIMLRAEFCSRKQMSSIFVMLNLDMGVIINTCIMS